MSTPKITEEKQAFGARVKEKRLAKGWSQAQLTKRLGVKSDTNVWNWEKGRSMPSKELLKTLAKNLGTTPDWLLNGEPKTEPTTIVIEKKDTRNPEGYTDMTAAKAIAKVMSEPREKKVYAPGDCVYSGTLKFVILKVFSTTALVTAISKFEVRDNRDYTCSFQYGGNTHYVDLSTIQSLKLTVIDKKAFEIPDIGKQVILHKFEKVMNIAESMSAEPVEIPKPDAVSLLFAESISYYNEKNNTKVKTPEGIISLASAVDISKQMGVSLEELTRDHTEDRKLDKLIALKEKRAALIGTLDDEIAALEQELKL